jgi:uncharacterized membrane protein YdjX (TVP38/TMEM64 family)
MKRFIPHVLFALFIFLILFVPHGISESFLQKAREFKDIQTHYPVATVFLFWLAHFVSSSLALPGACTALNMTAGFLFGFWPAIAIIYPVTVFSSLGGYFIGARFSRFFRGPALQRVMSAIEKNRRLHGHQILVLLRLSPFVPFTLINVACGILAVPLPAYLSSTIAGVFFDVVLLSGIGSNLLVAGGSMLQNGIVLGVFFVVYYITGTMRKKVRIFE